MRCEAREDMLRAEGVFVRSFVARSQSAWPKTRAREGAASGHPRGSDASLYVCAAVPSLFGHTLLRANSLYTLRSSAPWTQSVGKASVAPTSVSRCGVDSGCCSQLSNVCAIASSPLTGPSGRRSRPCCPDCFGGRRLRNHTHYRLSRQRTARPAKRISSNRAAWPWKVK